MTLNGCRTLRQNKMRTIQIAPYESDCRIVGNEIIGTMGGRTFVFELPANVSMPELDWQKKMMIRNFCEAIALCSKPWQVERLLNDHWGDRRRQVQGGIVMLQIVCLIGMVVIAASVPEKSERDV